MNMLIVIAVLVFLVMIHELGHFLAARLMGIRVREFGFGYPPRAFKLGKFWGTIFSVNWLPLGGFVRLAGDDGESMEGGPNAAPNQNTLDEDGNPIPQNELFSEAVPWKRLIVVVAGVVINILFGILAFTILYTTLGIPEQLPHPVIAEVIQGSPAETAQLKIGDAVLSLNKESIETSSKFIAKVQQERGKMVTLEIERDGKKLTLQPYVRTVEETPKNEGSLGVALNDVKIQHYPLLQMIPKATVKGIQDSLAFAQTILGSFKQLAVTIAQKHTVPSELSGPIGIVYTAQKEDVFAQGPFVVLNFAGLISLNLGVLNILPIPALDGGRAVFILLEPLLGKKRRSKWEGMANNVGMLFLLGLILLISVKDVVAIFKK